MVTTHFYCIFPEISPRGFFCMGVKLGRSSNHGCEAPWTPQPALSVPFSSDVEVQTVFLSWTWSAAGSQFNTTTPLTSLASSSLPPPLRPHTIRTADTTRTTIWHHLLLSAGNDTIILEGGNQGAALQWAEVVA